MQLTKHFEMDIRPTGDGVNNKLIRADIIAGSILQAALAWVATT
jgi:hypothetical protein